MKKKQKSKTNITKEDVAASKQKQSGKRHDDDIGSSLVTKLAIFGDSGFALVFSFAMMLTAIAVTVFMDEEGSTSVDHSVHRSHSNLPPMTQSKHQHEEQDNIDFDDLYMKLGPIPEIDPPIVYSIEPGDDTGDSASMKAIREAYQKDGVVAVRGLIPVELLDRLDLESRQLIAKEQERKHSASNHRTKQSTQFHTMYHSPAFLQAPSVVDESLLESTDSSKDATLESLQNLTAFLEVAVLSQVPKFGASLLSPELEENETVRMIRDIFLAKDEEEFICGWHVDDYGFWPATAFSPGINAWIALDDMPRIGGGGFALAVGSHEAPWRDEAHHVTGATTTFPVNGFQSAADMFANRMGSGTCNIKTAAPHLYRRMEDTKRIYEMKRGDIIFHQRWLFHRTVAFEREYVAQRREKNLLYRRYSVRFAPGSAIVPPGFGTELSVLYDDKNGNRTTDEASRDSPWYPRVYPSANAKELQGLKDLIEEKIPIAQVLKHARQKDMQPFLKEAAAKQQRQNKC